MLDLVFEDGREEFTINGDKSKVIRINTHDINLYDKILDTVEFIREKAKEYSEIKGNIGTEDIPEDKLKEYTSKMVEIDNEVKAEIDRILNGNITSVVFGNESCLSPIKDGYAIDYFLGAVLERLNENIGDEVKRKSNNYVNKVKNFK